MQEELSREQIRRNLESWIHDLETTDAKQGVQVLRTIEDGYCCLGRACVVMGGRFVRSEANEWFVLVGNSHRMYASLDEEVLRSLGLTWTDQGHLAAMNDRGGKTFPEIAAWLRENILPRFAPQSAVTER